MVMWRAHNPHTNTQSYLELVNWRRHVEKRPEIDGHETNVQDIVSDPEVVVERGTRVYKYRKGYGSGKTGGLWLLAIERPDHRGRYRIVTVFFVPHIEHRGTVHWRRPGIGGVS